MNINLRLDHLKGVKLDAGWETTPTMLASLVSKALDVQQLGFRADAATGVIFAQQLQAMSNRIREKAYPQFKGKNLLPMQNEAPFGAEEFAYVVADRVGMLKHITNYADDLPNIEVTGEKMVVNIRAFGGSIIYSVFEIAKATVAGMNIVDRKGMAIRNAAEQKLDQIIWVGDAETGLTGLYNAPNVTTRTAPNGATGSSSTWATKTAEEIYADLVYPITQQATDTLGAERPDTVVMTSASYERARTTFFTDNTGENAMERFKKSYPEITVETVEWLGPQGTGQANSAMIHYRNDSEKLGVEVPKPFTMMPPEARNLATVVDGYLATAGVVVYFPLSVTVTNGI